MKKFESTASLQKIENEEMNKIFKNQNTFIKGLIFFSFLQYLILLLVL